MRLYAPVRFGNGLGSASSDSAYLSVDGNDPVIVGDAGLEPGTWTWIKADDDLPLDEGTHDLTLRYANAASPSISSSWRSPARHLRLVARRRRLITDRPSRSEEETDSYGPPQGRRSLITPASPSAPGPRK